MGRLRALDHLYSVYIYIYILQSVRLKGQCSHEQWGRDGREGEFHVLSMTDEYDQLK